MRTLDLDQSAAPDDEYVDGAPEPDEPRPPLATRLLGGRTAADLGRAVLRWTCVLGSAVVIYAAFLVAKGADPAKVFDSMWASAAGDPRAIGETLLRATPLLLAALAVVVPARAGLFNIGGEGQLVMGAVGATGVAYLVGTDVAQPLTLLLMGLGGAAAGMVWASIPALLKHFARASEIITSLLLNYVATIFLAWLVFEPWKDPRSTGQAYSKGLKGTQRLPIIWGDRVNIGIVVAVAAAVVVWLVFRSTRWGFRLRVLGGNAEAARRAGFSLGALTIGAMVVGGALAGLGGMLQVSGVEARLRPDVMVGFGYIGFLAAWLGRQHPLKCIGAAVLLAAIAIGGNGLKMAAGLSGAAVNVLMALVLLAVLGWGRSTKTSGASR